MQEKRRPTSAERVAPVFRVTFGEERAAPPARRAPQAAPGAPPAPEEADAPEEGVYIISVAARILRMHPQTLRKYERAGLVRPTRTIGMLRLYSERDIAKLRMIKHLVDNARLNLAGVEMAMAVFDRLAEAAQAARAPAHRSSPQRAALPFEQAMQDIIDMFLGSPVRPSDRRGAGDDRRSE